ncbi:MAG TPA: calcium-binding protein, partial [Accumulibacter sp.]|uniref:calcium-binding protein n=1 Tax=Accumulibacter sp. TaxID=2053492 RepID=UPI002BB37CD7
GNDTYVFRRGGGRDTIYAWDSTIGRVDTLSFDGLNASDVQLEQWDMDLAFVVKNTSDAIRVQDFNSNAGYQIDAVQFADGSTWNRATLLAQELAVIGSAGNDTLYTRGSGARALYGNDGNDTLTGGDSTTDRLFGGNGNDRLQGGNANDTLDGGAGDDFLDGGGSNDTYVFRRGSGRDVIYSWDSTPGRIDTLKLDGLNPADVRLEQWAGDLAFVIKDTGEWIRVQQFLSYEATQIDAVQFADGTAWNRTTLMAQEFALIGGAGNDTLSAAGSGARALYGNDGDDALYGGSSTTDRLYGGNGNDSLSGSSGDDTLDGGAGNDTLEGGDGNDLSDGGAGDDRLTGSAGSDTYVFARGGGHDALAVNDSGAGKVDTVKLTGLSAAEIALAKWGSSLAIVIKNTGPSWDWLCIENFFVGPAYQIDRIEFGDGTAWSKANFLAQNIDVAGDGTANDLQGRNGGPNSLYGLGGNDTLAGGDGHDQMYGGEGNDWLHGGAGGDTLDGGPGNDT